MEKRHGVELRVNMEAGKIFCHYIAQHKREALVGNIAKAKFFSILLDGSTDSANVELYRFDPMRKFTPE